MAFHAKFAIGYNGSPVAWLGPDEVAWTCGNAVVLQSLSSKAQRVLKGTGFGISCFTISKRHGLIAVAEKGLKPNVVIYSTKSLQLLAKLSPGELSKEEQQELPGASSDKQQHVVSLGVTALGFSGDGERLVVCGDEPDCSVIVYGWRKGEVMGRSRLPPFQPACQASFHPLDPTILATTHCGTASVWFLETMWDRTLFRYQSLAPACLPPGHEVTVHAWSPHGLYVGTSSGGFALLDVNTMTPLAIGASSGVSEPPSPGAGSAAGGSSPTPVPPYPGQPAVVLDATGPGAAVSALALNRDHLAVCGTDGSVHVFSQAPVVVGHGPPVFSHEIWLARGGSTGVPIASAEVGGPDHSLLVLGCPDGTIYRAPLAPHTAAGAAARAGYTMATQVGDYPVGRLAGVVPHPGGGAFVTAGADGSVRLWATEDGHLLARKALGSAQSVLAAAGPGAGLAAVGSETGVVRVLVLPPAPAPAPAPGGDAGGHGVHSSGGSSNAPSQQLRVMYRRRLHTAPIDALAFSPNNDLLLSSGRDGAVWLLALDARTGSCRTLGFVPLPSGERVLSVTWPRAGSDVLEGETALLSLASGGMMSLTASAELTSGNWRNPNPDMCLVKPQAAVALSARGLGSETGDVGPGGVPEPVVVRLLRLEVPLLAVATSPHDRSGDLYALGADKQLHKLALPAEAAAWAGLRARPLRSAVHVPSHARPGGGVSMAPGGHVLVSGGADGGVGMRNLNLMLLGDSGGATAGGGGAALHDVTAGGVVSVSFDATGRYFASAGADGAVLVFEVAGAAAAPHLLVTPPWAAVPFAGSVTAASRVEAEAIDDPAELTEVELVRRQAALEASGGNGESKRAAVTAKLAKLRERIFELLKANQEAPELERLERSDVIVDVGLVGRLKADTEARVAAVAAGVRRNNLRTELLADRLRRMVWDSLAVKGAVISGLRGHTVVGNFPLSQPGSHERVLRQLTMLRRVELMEQQALGIVPYNFMFRGNGAEGSADGDDGFDVGMPTPDAAAAAAAAAVAAAAVASATGNGAADPDSLLYSDFDLHCNTRKALQMHLLKQKIRDLKAAFNADFARVSTQKRTDCDRIADLNARIDETIKDLRKLGAVPPAGLMDERYQLGSQDIRDNIQATVLTVRDEEVAVEKYVTPEERARQEAARRAEEEAAKRSARDNAGERALRQMMGGTLAPRGGGPDGESNPFSLPPPPWLAALGLDPDNVNLKMLSEEQTRELKDWQSREKSLQEERARRIGTLELELRTAKAAVEDVVTRFDDALAALAARRHRVAADVAALEARTVALAAGMARCARTSEAVERQLLGRLGSAKELHGRAAAELAQRRADLADLEARQAAAAAEERLLDRNFKKEFMDADLYYNRLLQLYRARRPEQLAAAAGLHHGGGGGAAAAGVAAQPSYGPGGGGGGAVPQEAPGSSFRTAPTASMVGAGAGSLHHQGSGHGGSPTAVPTESGSVAGHPQAAVPPPLPANAPPPTYSHAPPVLPSSAAASSLEAFPEILPGAPPPADGRPTSSSSSSGATTVHQHPAASGHSVGGHHSGHGHAHGGAGHLHAGGHSASALLDASYKPEGLDQALWDKFMSYRAARLEAEAALRATQVDLALARRDLPELESRDSSLSTEMEGLMSAITALRSERRTSAYDNELQLRLLAGQVEVTPPVAAPADLSDARLLSRSVVEALNSVVLGKGTKKVEILTAMKDFKRGIYAAQWEAAAADMRLEDLRAKIRDLQLLHVTRDMQAVLKDGEDRSSAVEAAGLEALMKQRERLHAKSLDDKRRRLAKLAADVAARSSQNQEVAVHLVTLGKVLEEQQRLQAGMHSSTEQAARRMRSLVTHKKLKEIALAQQNELAELRAQVEKLRLRTYPTFVELRPVAGMPSPPHRLPPDLKVLSGGPSSAGSGLGSGGQSNARLRP